MKTITLLACTVIMIGTIGLYAEGNGASSPIPKQRFLSGEGQGLAQKGGKHHGGKDGKGRQGHLRQMLKKKFDADGDGQLSEKEKGAAREAFKNRRAERIKKFDKDGDGKLGEAERGEARKAFQAKRGEITKKFDKDGDGKLSESERGAAREEFKKKHKHPTE